MVMFATDLFDIYAQTTKIVEQFPEMAEKYKPIQVQFEDKRSHPDARIMVYGVYNAGKSTLINALVGEEVAATGDIPLTDRVDSYHWNNTVILDTPGVDAPLEHEQVTREQMLKADAIIFVVNPSGAAEEEKTFKVLIDILQARKQLFLVLNDKDNMDVETLTRLKDDIRKRLQMFAEEKGMQEVLHSIPILRIKAKQALQAKLKKDNELLQFSEFPEFEDELKAFITGIDNQAVYHRLNGELLRFLDYAQEVLRKKETSEIVRTCDDLLKKIIKQQHRCRQTIIDEIKRQHDDIYYRCKGSIFQAPEQAQEKVTELLNKACEKVNAVLQQETDYLVQQYQVDIESLEAAFLQLEQVTSTCDIPLKMGEAAHSDLGKNDAKYELNTEKFNHAFTSLKSTVKPEHIVTGLKALKEWLPSLMKGIGEKTMEKWAGAVVGKWLPGVGLAITAINSLWGIFAEDSESKYMREQIEQQRRERERYLQEIDDFAHKTATQFETDTTQAINDVLTPWFKEIQDKVKASRDIASGQEQVIGEALLKIQRLSLQLDDVAG